MTGPELARQLSDLAQTLRTEAVEANLQNNVLDWWVKSGYANILIRAVDQAQRHHRRSVRAYGKPKDEKCAGGGNV